ncbi:hypothetical protein M433DRAFT_9573 [Acidomyces richmondensis BFW]|nr:hypothetical protein M433DRAFT_9573 [Acidomyces richmondensis BFW]
MVGYSEETDCSNAKGVKTWGVVYNGSDRGCVWQIRHGLYSLRGRMRMPVNGEELSVERDFWSGLAVEALRVGELSTAKVHRYARKRG